MKREYYYIIIVSILLSFVLGLTINPGTSNVWTNSIKSQVSKEFNQCLTINYNNQGNLAFSSNHLINMESGQFPNGTYWYSFQCNYNTPLIP